MDRISRVLAFAFVLAFSLTACDSAGPDAGPSAGAAAAPTAPSGHLTFASEAAFLAEYGRLAKMTADQAVTTKSSATFTSMQAAEQADAVAVESGTKQDSEVRLSVVEDPYLASLLSPEGVVQIDKTVYKVGPTKVFTGEEKDLTAFKNNDETQLGKSYASKAIERAGGATTLPGEPMLDNAGPVDGRCTTFSGSNNSTYKVCGSSFITNYWIIRSAGATTNVWKRGWFGIYYPVKGDNLSMTSQYRIAFGGQPLPAYQTASSSATNAWILARIYAYGLSNGPKFIGNVNTTHRTTHANRSATATTAATSS